MGKILRTILFFFFILPTVVLATTTATTSFTVTQQVSEPSGGSNPPPPPPPPALTISSINSSPALNKIDISWQTSNAANCYVSYGQTAAYGLGPIFSAGAITTHTVSLSGLLSDTTYHFQISCTDSNAQSAVSSDYSAKTSAPPLPSNILGINVVAGIKKLTLSWTMPNDPNIVRVKIYRSNSFYPQNPSEGVLIYDSDGSELSYINNNLIAGTRYYFTAFSFDSLGRNSTGAVGDGVPLAEEEEPVEPIVPVVPVVPPDQGPGTPEGGIMSPGSGTSSRFLDKETKYTQEQKEKLKDIDFLKFDFFQGKDNLNAGALSKIKAGDKLEIAIDQTQIPDFVKSVLVMFEKDDKRFTFLLQKDTQGKLRSDLMVPMDKRGAYKVTIFLIDKDNNIVKKIQGEMEVLNPGFLRIKMPEDFWKKALNLLIETSRSPAFWPIIIILGLVIFVLQRMAQLRALRSMKRTIIESGGSKIGGNSIVLAPCNILEFGAVSLVGSVMLTWKNPPEKFGKNIKIIKSNSSHRIDHQGGSVVYEGLVHGPAEQFIDNTARDAQMIYYSAFISDENGQYSSGALAWAKPLMSAGEEIIKQVSLPYAKNQKRQFEVPVQASEGVNFSDLSFFQNDQNIDGAKGPVASSSFALEIIAGESSVPALVKILILEVLLGGRSSFLLLGRGVKGVLHCSFFLPATRETEMALKIHSLDQNYQIVHESSGKITISK